MITTTTIACEKTSHSYRREEDDEIIRWFKDNSIFVDFSFRKSEGVWRYHGYPFQLSKVLEFPPDIELQYQKLHTKDFKIHTTQTSVSFDDLAWTRLADEAGVTWLHEMAPDRENTSYRFDEGIGWSCQKGIDMTWIDCEKPEIEKLYQKYIRKF
jgi:hypothetical protein